MIEYKKIVENCYRDGSRKYYIVLEHQEQSHSFMFDLPEETAKRIIDEWPHEIKPGVGSEQTYYIPQSLES
jgi:hypothetical protein